MRHLQCSVAFLATASLSLGVLGCSTVKHGKQPASAPATTAVAAVATTPKAVAAATPASGAVGGWVYAPHPARSIARLRALLASAPNALGPIENMLLKVQGFDLEQPAYLVSNGKEHVFSFGLSPELAETLRKSNEDETCAVVEVRGAARFACGVGAGKAPADLAQAAPPRTTTSDLHVEATASDLNDLAKGKVGGDKAFDSLFGIDRMTLDVNLEGKPELRFAWHLSGERSATAGWLNAPLALPPTSFAQLPADSEMAVFAHAPPAADQAELKKIVLDLFDDKDAECPGNAAAERAQVEKLFFTGGPIVGAAGGDRAKAEAAAEALVKAPTDKKKIAATRDAMKGWGIIGVDEPASRWVDGMFALQKRDCPTKGKPKHKITLTKKLPPRLALPAGTVEITNVTPTSRNLILVAPDARSGIERTWIVIASDEATAVARLKGVLAGPSALMARPGLAALKEPASLGMFVTTGGLSWLSSDDKTDAEVLVGANKLLRAKSLPTGGRTPIVLRMSSSHDPKGKGGETNVRVSLDGAALGDIATLLF